MLLSVSTLRAEQESRPKVLVVDDEPSITDAVATALRYEGFDVEEATTGRAALTAVERSEPDLVVLDWMLPDIEGIEVGRRLRDQGFKTAILFLTAKDAVENKVDAHAPGDKIQLTVVRGGQTRTVTVTLGARS